MKNKNTNYIRMATLFIIFRIYQKMGIIIGNIILGLRKLQRESKIIYREYNLKEIVDK